MSNKDAETESAANRIAGVVISGGQSRRWGGGDKFLAKLAGKTLLRHVVDQVRDQVRLLTLNANGAAGRYQGLGLAVV
ncbi:MAG: NTP transferase domain-containing protein, partial [Rhodospirillales bacterium]|nr:NTP transferase domain-containing protein [Rhodospirillales bacterium]